PKDCRRRLATLDDPMPHRGDDKQTYGDHEEQESCAFENATPRGNLFKQFLKGAVELEAKQHLCTKYQESGLIKCGLEFALRTHSSPSAPASGLASDGPRD